MLKVKSFDISDDKGINDLLTTYRLASGASILISDGKICVPYEDGNEDNNAQKIIFIKEQKNKMLVERFLLVHSQEVLEINKANTEAKIKEVEATLITTGGKKKDYDANKEKDAELKRLNNTLTQTNNQILMNLAELGRIDANVLVFDKKIAELS